MNNNKTYRPYSAMELDDLDNDINKKFKIGNTRASHYACRHTYRVKKGGKKELSILDSSDGYLPGFMCSVCYKLRTSVEPINDDIIAHMNDECVRNDDFVLTKNIIDEKLQFYKWLYSHDDY